MNNVDAYDSSHAQIHITTLISANGFFCIQHKKRLLFLLLDSGKWALPY